MACATAAPRSLPTSGIFRRGTLPQDLGVVRRRFRRRASSKYLYYGRGPRPNPGPLLSARRAVPGGSGTVRASTSPPLDEPALGGSDLEQEEAAQALIPPFQWTDILRAPWLRVKVAPVAVASPATSIIVPTFNEAASLPELLLRIRRAVPGCEVIVVDDSSKDGTAEAAEGLGARVLRRGRKLGLASAVLDGFEISRGGVVGVLDADLSHPPELIPRLIEIAEGGRIAVASRYVAGGRVSAWALRRRMMSRAGASVARLALKIEVRDCMSGFFFAPRAAFERTQFRAEGFKLLLNVLVDNPGIDAVEVPYEFSERVHGRSKLGAGEILSFWRTLRALRA